MNGFEFCRVSIILVLGMCFSKTMVGSVVEGQPSLLPQETNFILEGKITRKAPNKLTINTQDNIVFHASYDEKTEIKRQDGSQGSAKDLRVGNQVRVAGELTETGEIKAQTIEVEQSAGSQRR